MHNLWIRQHNTLVERLKRINPHWNPEQLYQEARKIGNFLNKNCFILNSNLSKFLIRQLVGAQMQSITFRSWLPKILGPTGMKMLGEYRKYDPLVDSATINEFATAAFRLAKIIF